MGYVSLQTGVLALVAEADPFILDRIRIALAKGITNGRGKLQKLRRICFRYNRAELTKEAKDQVGPILRQIPARVVGVGFRPEHVKDR